MFYMEGYLHNPHLTGSMADDYIHDIPVLLPYEAAYSQNTEISAHLPVPQHLRTHHPHNYQ